MDKKRNRGFFRFWIVFFAGLMFVTHGMILLTRHFTHPPHPVYLESALISLLISFVLVCIIALINYYWIVKRFPVGGLIYLLFLVILFQVYMETIEYLQEKLIPVMGTEIPTYLEPIVYLLLGAISIVISLRVNKKYNKDNKKIFLPVDE